VDRELKFDRERLNVNGARSRSVTPRLQRHAILVTLVHELARRKARYGLATLCVSGGQGMAMLAGGSGAFTLPAVRTLPRLQHGTIATSRIVARARMSCFSLKRVP
jgi:hypothetical protein